MSFDAVRDLIRDAERAAALAGIPAAKAAEVLIRAEEELMQALLASQRAERQLLLELRDRGATELAKQRGVSRAQVYVLRDRALNKLSRIAVQG
ncbi:hypothetical protein [Luteimonas saliphila]|uniref:hypothetical protein n=1 Tax=Luteimonas saliphila TaxID=2804919 RepID=UPI00192DBAB6|nr:hypothetical protein [Luteimonas saliphila]